MEKLSSKKPTSLSKQVIENYEIKNVAILTKRLIVVSTEERLSSTRIPKYACGKLVVLKLLQKSFIT